MNNNVICLRYINRECIQLLHRHSTTMTMILESVYYCIAIKRFQQEPHKTLD